MKKAILVLNVIMITLCSFTNTPPSAVQKAFEQKFAGATNVSWAKENKKEWEASFKLNATKVSANFSNEGTWIETETEISVSLLPASVVASIKKQYPNSVIVEADKIENSKKETIYEADIKIGKKKKEVILNTEGTFLK